MNEKIEAIIYYRNTLITFAPWKHLAGEHHACTPRADHAGKQLPIQLEDIEILVR